MSEHIRRKPKRGVFVRSDNNMKAVYPFNIFISVIPIIFASFIQAASTHIATV